MQVKKFFGASIPATMRDIRRTLGPEAIILSTRNLPPNTGIRLPTGRARVEITAAMETPEPEREMPAPLFTPLASQGKQNPRQKSAPRESIPTTSAGISRPEANRETQMADLLNEIKALRRIFESGAKQLPPQAEAKPILDSPAPAERPRDRFPDDALLPARALRNHLLDQGVDPKLLDQINEAITQAQSDFKSDAKPGTRRRLEDYLASRIPALPDRSPKAPRITALIGPTGVGKTTTIAKIASRRALHENKDVALISLDTYRIAAADQMATYARLLGVPLEVVSGSDDLARAIDRFSGFDEILIDTAGCSPKDKMALKDLATTFSPHPEIEIHLLVCCSTRRTETRYIMQCYEAVGYDRLVFTKMDEATAWGDTLNTWLLENYAVSFFTTGQRVPEDLEHASVPLLCQYLLGDINN